MFRGTSSAETQHDAELIQVAPMRRCQSIGYRGKIIRCLLMSHVTLRVSASSVEAVEGSDPKRSTVTTSISSSNYFFRPLYDATSGVQNSMGSLSHVAASMTGMNCFEIRDFCHLRTVRYGALHLLSWRKWPSVLANAHASRSRRCKVVTSTSCGVTRDT